MRLEYEPLQKIKDNVLEAVQRHLDLNQYKLFFFGSRVAGKGNERSDVDLGILGEKPISAGIFSEIEDEIENIPVLYTIDIVDFNNVSEKFKQVALEEVEYLN